MNIIHDIRRLLGAAFIILHSSFFISCSDDFAEGIFTKDDGIAFVVADDAATRLSYSGTSTTFSDGDSVGCVVCKMSSATATDDNGTSTTTYSYDFVANALWTYDATNNALVVKKLWQVPGDGTTLTEVTPTEGNAATLLSYNGAKTLVGSSDNLYLFFYYPFIDPAKDYNTKMGPPSATADGTTLYSYDSSSLTPYSWRTWPLFVNSCTATASNTLGDWMDARYLQGVSSSTTGDIAIQFKHRTAAICISAKEAISNVKLVLAESTDESTDNIKIGQQIDLASGTLTDYSTAATDEPDKYAYLTATTDTLYSYKIDKKNYRFYLPAQSSWAGRLIYQYDSDATTTTDDDGNTVTVNDSVRALSLASLGNGTLAAATKYDVNIPTGPNYVEPATYWLYFTGTATAASNYKESHSGFFTMGTRGTPSSQNCTELSTSLEKAGIVDNVSEFTYAIQFRNSSQAGEYVGFEVPTTIGTSQITLIVYLANQSSTPKLRVAKLNTSFDFSNDVTASDTQTGAISTTPYNAESDTDDYGNSIFKVTVNLDAGYKYMIYYGSGTAQSPLIVLSNDTDITGQTYTSSSSTDTEDTDDDDEETTATTTFTPTVSPASGTVESIPTTFTPHLQHSEAQR